MTHKNIFARQKGPGALYQHARKQAWVERRDRSLQPKLVVPTAGGAMLCSVFMRALSL